MTEPKDGGISGTERCRCGLLVPKGVHVGHPREDVEEAQGRGRKRAIIVGLPELRKCELFTPLRCIDDRVVGSAASATWDKKSAEPERAKLLLLG